MGILNEYCEKDIELMIFNNKDEMPSRGFNEFYKNAKRQVTLPMGGIIDILTWEIIDNSFFCKVIELKKDCIDLKALRQAIDYYSLLLVGLQNLYVNVSIEIVLVGRIFSQDIGDLEMLNIPTLKLYSYDFNYNGLILEKFKYGYEFYQSHADEQLGAVKEDFIAFKQKHFD